MVLTMIPATFQAEPKFASSLTVWAQKPIDTRRPLPRNAGR